MNDRDDHRPQVLHVVHHVDDHILRFLYKLIQAPTAGGLTQAAVDALTASLKQSNDSLEAKLTPPANPAP